MTQTGITQSSQVIDGMDATVWTLEIDGEQVAHLDIHASGLILNVEVNSDHRGEGHARALYEAATEAGDVYHVPAWGRSAEGDGFAEAMGGDVMDDQDACDILGLDLDTVTGALWA